MAEKGNPTRIKNEGPHWAGAILETAEEYIDDPALAQLSLAARAWRAGAIMVRTGLSLCERREPGLYHDFLVSVGLSVCLDHGLIEETDTVGGSPKLPWRLCDVDGPQMAVAERMLDECAVKEPRAVAFALIREGLRVCLLYAPERYPGFVRAVCTFIIREAERVQDAPRQYVQTDDPKARWKLRILPWTFNVRAAGSLS